MDVRSPKDTGSAKSATPQPYRRPIAVDSPSPSPVGAIAISISEWMFSRSNREAQNSKKSPSLLKSEGRSVDMEDAARQEWLTRFWCAKEAVGKAVGRGLIHGPQSVIVRAWIG